MKWALTAFGTSLLLAAASLAASFYLLPAQVASHFNAVGMPDAWSSRGTHLVLMACVGLLLPTLMLLVFWGIRYLPVSVINLPNREYWLAAKRREGSLQSILEMGIWFVVGQTLFFLCIHWFVVAANRQAQVRLSMAVWVLLIVYVLLVTGWLWKFWQRFRLPT